MTPVAPNLDALFHEGQGGFWVGPGLDHVLPVREQAGHLDTLVKHALGHYYKDAYNAGYIRVGLTGYSVYISFGSKADPKAFDTLETLLRHDHFLRHNVVLFTPEYVGIKRPGFTEFAERQATFRSPEETINWLNVARNKLKRSRLKPQPSTTQTTQELPQ